MGATSTKIEQQKLFRENDTPIKRSTFQLGYKNKLTAPFNKLVPTCSKHIMPGDSVHTNTSFFTRWLGLQAPVFSDYQMKFGSWFMKYSQLWAGFDQFWGEGDSQSADYLIDGSQSNKYGSRVPYFTSRDLSDIAWGRLFPSFLSSLQTRQLDVMQPLVKEPYRKFFKSVLVPVCAFRAVDHEYNHVYSDAPSDWLAGYYQGNDVEESVKNAVILTPMMWKNDTFTQNCIDNGLIFDLDSVPENADKYDLSDWVTLWSGTNLTTTTHTRQPKWAFTYVGTNLPIFRDENGEQMEFAVYEMSHDCLPFDKECFGTNVSYKAGSLPDEGEYADLIIGGWIPRMPSDPDHDPVTQYFGLCNNFHYHRVSVAEHEETGFTYSYYVECDHNDSVSYQLYGYMRSLCPTELRKADGSVIPVTWRQLWERTFGGAVVKALLGTGTLADYLGYNYEEQLLRQDFKLASAIQVSRTYNGVAIAHNPYKYKKTELGSTAGVTYQNNRWAKDLAEASQNQLGNYNRESAMISVAIVNDVPISCFKFLAYHKCFSDTLRDTRYQLRYVYCDPYVSPFLVPRSDGTFLSGHLFARTWNSDQEKYDLDSSMLFDQIGAGRSAICIANWFTCESLIEFLTLRDRRITQDYNTLIVPTQQYGEDPASCDYDVDVSSIKDVPDNHKRSVYYMTNSDTDGEGSFYAGTSSANSTKIDLSGKVSIDANSLRYLGRLQKYLERSLTAGSSYVKQVLARFGVTPSQSVSQRVESRYLGGDRYYPTVSPIEMLGANSAESGQTTGSQTGQLSCSGTTGEISFKSNDAGLFIQLLTIQNEFLTCGNETEMIEKFDFPMPEFADLQPQAVPLSEIVLTDGTDNNGYGKADPNLCFGYVPRYASHKCSKDQIHGQFKTDLAYWVTPRRFNPNLSFGSFGLGDKNNVPEVGENFLYENPNYDAFVDMSDDTHKCIIDLQHYFMVSRELPVLPMPTLH